MKKKGKKRRARGLAKKLKMDFLKRELEYGRLTMTKCMQNWKDMLAIMTNKYLAEDLLSSCHIFEKTIDYKDLQISVLMDWLEDELQQHEKAFGYHTSLIDRLIDYFQKTYRGIYDDLASKVNEMISEWTEMNNLLSFRCEENQRYIETMLYQMTEMTKKQEYEFVAKRFSFLDECRAASETLLNNLKAIMHNKVEKLYDHVVKFTTQFAHKTGKKKKLCQIMQAQHEIQEREISSSLEKIFSKKKLIQTLTDKFEKYSHMKGKQVKTFNSERDNLNECFLTLRMKLFNDKKNDLDKRCLLVSRGNAVFHQLEAKAREGSKMIKCLTSCRKYEFFHEKLCPYPTGTSELGFKMKAHFQKYDLFWLRMGNANNSR